MQSPTDRKNKTAYLGLLTAFSLILSYIETLIPFQIGIPGIKIGLANFAVVLCLYLFGYKEAVLLTCVKALVSGFLFGNLSVIIYSLVGALLSVFIMILMKRSGGFHIPVVSAGGGIMHNMGQLLVAAFTVKTYSVLYYAPVLIIAGLITGLLIGMATSLVPPYVKKVILKGVPLE